MKKKNSVFKLNSITKIILLTISSLLLVSCGEGGEEGGGTKEPERPVEIVNPKKEPEGTNPIPKSSDFSKYQENYNPQHFETTYYTVTSSTPLADMPISKSEKLNENNGRQKHFNNLTTQQIAGTKIDLKTIPTKESFNLNVNKNIIEVENFYHKEENNGSFSKQYIESLNPKTYLEKSNNSSIKGRDNITQVSNVEDKHFIFNSGLKNTSGKWNEETIKKEFNWDRLERDRITPLENATDTHGIIRDTSNYDHLISDDVKVLVIDHAMQRTGNIDQDRVTQSYFIEEDGGLKLTNNSDDINYSHGDDVVYTMMGKPYDNYFENKKLGEIYILDWHDKRVQYHYPGFLVNKGKVHVYGNQKNFNGSYIMGHEMVKSDDVKKLIKDGYNIVNMSWAVSVPKKTIEELRKIYGEDKTIPELLNNANYSLGREYLEHVKNDDAIFVASLGNDRDESISGEVQMPRLKNTLGTEDGFIAVGAYNPLTDKKADYSNSCFDAKEWCIFAKDRHFYQYNEKYNYQFPAGYSTGTSLATPYISSTLALLKSVFPFLKNSELKDTLLTTAKDLGEEGVDRVYGWGLVQPHLAIQGPAQFFRKDFVVDFNHNKEMQGKNRVYRFSNDINGKYGLTVKGSDNNNALSLSGHNTYQGNTNIENKAILNIDGINENDVYVKEGGRLFGSGKINNIHNNGNVFNYSIFKNIYPNDTRSQYGMIIDGNYTQTNKGVLSVLLGQPLLVKGFAILDGVLIVQDIKKAFVSKYGKVFEDVLVSLKGISGKFNSFYVPDYLTNSTIKYNSMDREGGKLYSVSIYADYEGINKTLNEVNNTIVKLSKETEETLKQLDKKINDKIENLVSNSLIDNKKIEKTIDEITQRSKLTSFLADIQARNANVKDDLETLNGKEIKKDLEIKNKVDKIAHFNLIKNNLENKNGISIKYNLENLGRETKGNLNLLNLTYQNKDYNFGFQLNTNKVKDNKEIIYQKSNGVDLLIGKKINNNLSINSSIGLLETKTKLNQDYNFKELKNKLSFFVDESFKPTENSSFKPFLGYSFSLNKTKEYVEKTKNYEFYVNIPKQKRKDHDMFLGFSYNQHILPEILNLKMRLDYYFNYKLNKNKDLKIKT